MDSLKVGCRYVYVEEQLDPLGAVCRNCHRAAPHLPSCVEEPVSQQLAMFARHCPYQTRMVQMNAAALSCFPCEQPLASIPDMNNA